jgi:hypothetical protein
MMRAVDREQANYGMCASLYVPPGRGIGQTPSILSIMCVFVPQRMAQPYSIEEGHATPSRRSKRSDVEGINNTIKIIKRRAYGYRDEEYFFLKIRAAFPGHPR